MLVAIDFDGTWTADPYLFRALVALLRSRGHDAVVVTARADRVMLSDPTRHWGDEVRAAVAGLVPIVFAPDDWKREAARRAGFLPDVWIDDDPAGVGPKL